MKKMTKFLGVLIISILFTALQTKAQTGNASNTKNTSTMKTYVIERNIPGAGEFTPEKLKSIAQTSCAVLRDLGPGIQWIQSYVTENKIFCIYKAESVELLKEHAQKGGFPINAVYEVDNVISPATAK